jgi:hypothetical protein
VERIFWTTRRGMSMADKKEEDKISIDAVIRFWESELTHSRWIMDSATQTLVERTIELLGKVKE